MFSEKYFEANFLQMETNFSFWCFSDYQLTIGLPRWLCGKEYACQCRRHRFDPRVGKMPREGNGNPFQYSCLGNPMDRGALQAAVDGVAKSQTRLSD